MASKATASKVVVNHKSKVEEFQCLLAEWCKKNSLKYWNIYLETNKWDRWIAFELRLQNNASFGKKIQREEGGVEGICKFFLRITIAKNNSRRKDSEEMAECLQPPKFHTVKTGRGELSEICLTGPLKSTKACFLLSRPILLAAHLSKS